MVWCLLVVPNYCMVDALAKVNKTAEATQIPLCSTHNWAWREMDTGNNLTLIGLVYFGHSKKKLLRSACFFFPNFILWWIKNESMPLSFFDPTFALGPSECAVDSMKQSFWNQNIPCQKFSSFVFWWLRLLLNFAPIQTYYGFVPTSFTCHKAPSLCCLLNFCLRSGKATLKCRHQN